MSDYYAIILHNTYVLALILSLVPFKNFNDYWVVLMPDWNLKIC